MKKPVLNILQTCFSPSWGGLEIQALEVALKMSRRGHNVWLACNNNARLADEARTHDLKTLTAQISGYVHPGEIWKLSRFLRREHIDIIHSHLSKDIATLVPALKLAGSTSPLVLSKRVGSYIQKMDLFHRYTYANVSKVLAISDVIRRNVIATTPVPANKVVTVHDAIDLGSFAPQKVVRRRVRYEFGYHDDTTVVGFVGRFSPGKGHEDLLDAASILRKTHPHVQYLVVGEASHGELRYEQRIRNICTSHGLDDSVTFAGFRRDIPEVMAAFDIFAFPAHAESFGVVLIEAMAMERPVVSTNCDGVLDIVVNGETGLYVHPRQPQELAYALAQLIENPALRERMGKAGRKRVQELFDQEKQIGTIEELYYELLDLTKEPATTQEDGS